MPPANKPATYDDLFDLPDGTRVEILAGDITTSPAPLPRHSRAQGALRRFVGGAFDDDHDHGGPGGWWILLEVDVRLGPYDVVGPDLSGWRRERLLDPWDQRPIDVVPDWVCEVISPSNAAQDRVTKRRLYAEHGVAFYWIVDPEARTLEAMRLFEGQWLEIGSYTDDPSARVQPFEAIHLEVARLFPPPTPPSTPPSP